MAPNGNPWGRWGPKRVGFAVLRRGLTYDTVLGSVGGCESGILQSGPPWACLVVACCVLRVASQRREFSPGPCQGYVNQTANALGDHARYHPLVGTACPTPCTMSWNRRQRSSLLGPLGAVRVAGLPADSRRCFVLLPRVGEGSWGWGCGSAGAAKGWRCMGKGVVQVMAQELVPLAPNESVICLARGSRSGPRSWAVWFLTSQTITCPTAGEQHTFSPTHPKEHAPLIPYPGMCKCAVPDRVDRMANPP